MADDALFATPPDDMVHEPRHRVIARLPGPDEAAAAVAEFVDKGVAKDDVYVLCGDEGLRRLDPTGAHHGLQGRIIRAVETVVSAGGLLQEDADHLKQGGVLVSAPARNDEERKVSQDVLREHGASRMRYYGVATFTDVG